MDQYVITDEKRKHDKTILMISMTIPVKKVINREHSATSSFVTTAVKCKQRRVTNRKLNDDYIKSAFYLTNKEMGKD